MKVIYKQLLKNIYLIVDFKCHSTHIIKIYITDKYHALGTNVVK